MSELLDGTSAREVLAVRSRLLAYVAQMAPDFVDPDLFVDGLFEHGRAVMYLESGFLVEMEALLPGNTSPVRRVTVGSYRVRFSYQTGSSWKSFESCLFRGPLEAFRMAFALRKAVLGWVERGEFGYYRVVAPTFALSGFTGDHDDIRLACQAVVDTVELDCQVS